MGTPIESGAHFFSFFGPQIELSFSPVTSIGVLLGFFDASALEPSALVRLFL